MSSIVKRKEARKITIYHLFILKNSYIVIYLLKFIFSIDVIELQSFDAQIFDEEHLKTMWK